MALLTGIDLGTYSIKIVQGQMNGPLFKLGRVIEIPLDCDGDSEAEILQGIQAELAAYKLKQGIARVGLTGRDLMMRYTSVPPVPLWRLKMLMDFEIQDMASNSGDSLTADYNILHSLDDDADETVLVSLVKSYFLEARLRALGTAGVTPFAATPNCVALFNSFVSFGEMNDSEYTFLLDIGDHNLEMAIQQDGELLFARNVSGGGDMFSAAIGEAWGVSKTKSRELKHEFGNMTPRGRATYASSQEEKVANAIMGVGGQLSGMIQSTINFARTQNGLRGMTIGRVVISGGGAQLKGIDAYLEQSLNMPVQRFTPDAGLDLSGLGPDDLGVFDADPSGFAVALGLARMSADSDAFVLDIVPDATKKKRNFLNKTVYMIGAGVIAACFLAFMWVDLSGEAASSKKAASTAKSKERSAVAVRNRYEDRAREVATIEEKLNAIAWESRAGTYLLWAQGLVQDQAPQAVWITDMDVATRAVMPPGQESAGRKAAVEKVVVIVKGEIRQLGEGVTAGFNRFVEGLRGASQKPYIDVVQRPADSGGDFELRIDFRGWPQANADSEEEGDES